MYSLCFLKNVSFEIKNNFEELSEKIISKSIENNIEFIKFNNTKDFQDILSKTFGENSDFEIITVHYNKDYLIQSFSLHDKNSQEECIVIKRYINDGNDNYTYNDYVYNKPETDIYKFANVTISDIINIIRRKSIIKCVIIDNDVLNNDEFIIKSYNDDVGTIILKNSNEEIKYLNICNINKKNMCDKQYDELINEKQRAYYVKYLFMQIEIPGLCIFNCYYESHSKVKNKLMSEILDYDVYGKFIIFLQSNLNNDSESILDINKTLFIELYNIITKKKCPTVSNKYFINLYKEFNIVFNE